MMTDEKKQIKRALISVYHKDGLLEDIIKTLHNKGVQLLSTGGTQTYIESLGIPCEAVEHLTGYPSILGGRVKTLHPKIFGGILARRQQDDDLRQLSEYEIPMIDLVIVDLYPFEETLAAGADEAAAIEKIDIGGISLIRAAAKNYRDVAIIASEAQYERLLTLLKKNGAQTTLAERRSLAREAFAISSGYDVAIYHYFDAGDHTAFRAAADNALPLRYGENPHQRGTFYGRFNKLFTRLHGKQISYNNLLDIDAAVALIDEFDEPTFAILKHNNACGVASRPTMLEAWKDALAGDPVSAFGGVLVANRTIDAAAAGEIDRIFFEVIIAPDYTKDALFVLRKKKNRIILQRWPGKATQNSSFRSLLNGVLVQDRDKSTQTAGDLKPMTESLPTESEIADLLFANKIVKHSKSNAITLAKNKQLCANSVGQMSRVDALKQAIDKAHAFGFDLQGAVMASDAFFPFPDCVKAADEAGITAVIQPGGSVNDELSIDYCNAHQISMVKTGIRHFKH